MVALAHEVGPLESPSFWREIFERERARHGEPRLGEPRRSRDMRDSQSSFHTSLNKSTQRDFTVHFCRSLKSFRWEPPNMRIIP
jgi:hypothetical protein